MISGREFLSRVINKYGAESVHYSFRFPLVYLAVVSDVFAKMDDEEREDTFSESLALTIDDLRRIKTRLFFNVRLLDAGEGESARGDRGEYWLRLLVDESVGEASVELTDDRVKIVHFYGHKGGQSRSTVLSFLARALADNQWRVLAVDVDAEAPSLDAMFGASPPEAAATLVGVRAGHGLRPYRVYTGSEGGVVDLVAFQDDSDGVDLDSAALAMELAISPPSNDQLVRAVRAAGDNYDAIFVDHRSGLGATVPPWVRGLPGPIVAFARMDGQWRRAKSHLSALWALRPGNPGLLVSFKPDDEPDSRFVVRHIDQARSALECLADAMSLGLPDQNEVVSADDVTDHWIVWPYDPAFREESAARFANVGSGVRQAVLAMERVLGLRGAPRTKNESLPIIPTLHPSGAQDEGDFIVTRALRTLSAPSSPVWFVTGRKGTGKTRLVRELTRLGQGSPLLVAEGDSGDLGVDARHSSLMLFMEEKVGFEKFWWTLLGAASKVGIGRQELVREVEAVAARITSGENPLRTLLDHLGSVSSDGPPQVFLIDGLETAFPREDTHEFVGALFRVWSTIESDERLRSRIGLRIFIRTDLANRGFENFEQLSHGRTLELRWNTQYILNFALSRMSARTWFRDNFPDAMREIDHHYNDILQGGLEVGPCEDILLKVFPERLRRQNMLTSTFLRTWFSDDPKAEQGFYPRIYDLFLGTIADPPNDSGFTEAQLEHGAINQDLIFFAHERATSDFLMQVQVELRNLVDLTDDEIMRFIDAFRGTITPFSVEDIEDELSSRTSISAPRVRQALEQMKALGVFESRPGSVGQWRAGRLFKTSLGMVYDRKRKK
jgi:hypothetical protein